MIIKYKQKCLRGIFQCGGSNVTTSFTAPDTEQTFLENCRSTDVTFKGNIDKFIGARNIIGSIVIGSTKITNTY